MIFMIIKENIRNHRKITEKLRGYTYKITNISAANCNRATNMILTYCLDIKPKFYSLYWKCLNFKINIINKTIRNEKKTGNFIAMYPQNKIESNDSALPAKMAARALDKKYFNNK